MKKWSSLFLIVLFIMSTACSASGEDAVSKNTPAKILYINSDDGGPHDTIIIKRLKKLGYEVNERGDFALAEEDAAGHDVIVISDSAVHKNIGGKYNLAAVPVVFFSPRMAYNMQLADKDLSGTEHNVTRMKIKADDHPIVSGLSGEVDVYTETASAHWVTPNKEAEIIAALPGDDSKAMIFTYEKGALDSFVNPRPLPARRAFIYLNFYSVMEFTDASWSILDNAVKWAMESPEA